MPNDLAALTPPLLVALAFLIGVGAFIRHEMRRGKNRDAVQQRTDSIDDSSGQSRANDAGHGSTQRSLGERSADSHRDRRDQADPDQ